MNPDSEKHFTPPYPKPLSVKNKPSIWQLYKLGRKSALHILFGGDYKKDLSITNISGYKIFTAKDPKIVREILKNNYSEYPKHRYMHDMLRPLLGNSIFTTNGEVWARQRRIMDIGFEKAGLKNVFTLMTEAVEQMLRRLDKVENGAVVDMEMEMTHVTADIIMRTILSKPISSVEAFDVFRHFEEYQEQCNSLFMLRLWHIPKFFKLKTYLTWKKRGKQIRKFIGDIIKMRHEEFVRLKGKTDYGDILEAVMSTKDPETGTSFSTKELIDQIVMLFLAGHETSASALGWALYILSHQPEHGEALSKEAEEVFGEKSMPTFKETTKLKKTRDVFRETLRLYPPVTQFSRESTGKCPIAGHEVKAKTAVNVNSWLIHRREELWKNPHSFCPHRFSEGENKQNPGAYIPFSMGPRVCIGAAFAQQEALLILSSITKKYYITPDETHTPDPVSRLTLRSDNGIKVRLSRRNQQPEGVCPYH